MPITSSSIFSSELAATAWRRFALALVGVAAALTAALVAAAWLLDPYDTGRSPLFAKAGVRPQGPRTAGASRGRDPAFNAAIIGNSHIQALSPERLNALTGLSFVQLSIVATGPKEQFAVLDWFMRHHSQPRAIVIGADKPWCEPALAGWANAPFPFWLYSHNPVEYLRGLVRLDVLREIPRRVSFLLSRRPTRARPDGYWDYEPTLLAAGRMTDPEHRAALERRTDDYIRNPSGRFRAAERLREVVSGLPPATTVIVVIPPTYRSLLPAPGSAGDQDNRACKAALAAALAGRPNAALLDWRADRPEAHVAEWFFDGTHYRHPLAELVERDVAAALSRTATNLGR
jgi:hypothetical protein